MIIVRDVVDLEAVDVFEEGLLAPVPGLEKNTIVLEERDGSNVRRFTAKGASVWLDGKKQAEVSDARIDVFVTDARLALACSKFEKGGGWVGFGSGALVAGALNAGSKALAARRRRGRMLVGQIRYPWLSNVGSKTKFGWLSEEGLHLWVTVPDGRMELQLQLPKDVDAAGLAAEITRRAAAHRLACHPEVSPEDNKWCESLVNAERLEPKKDTIRYFKFAKWSVVGEESARDMDNGSS